VRFRDRIRQLTEAAARSVCRDNPDLVRDDHALTVANSLASITAISKKRQLRQCHFALSRLPLRITGGGHHRLLLKRASFPDAEAICSSN